LNKYYPGCWIGCGSPSPMPLTWPPRIPDCSTQDNSLWGIIKGQVLHITITTMTSCTELWNRCSSPLHHKCFSMSHRTWWSLRLCFKHNSAHTDPPDVQWLSPHSMMMIINTNTKQQLSQEQVQWNLYSSFSSGVWKRNNGSRKIIDAGAIVEIGFAEGP
jgi:hypothetical protein